MQELRPTVLNKMRSPGPGRRDSQFSACDVDDDRLNHAIASERLNNNNKRLPFQNQRICFFFQSTHIRT